MIRRFAIFVVGIYLRLFYHHKAYGLEHIPQNGGIIAPNHCSFLDPPIVGVSCPQEVHFLARNTLFNFGPFGWLIRKLNTHPVVRGRENVATFKLACELIESGKKIVIFPEGHRSPDGELHPGQIGVSALVLRTGCIVVPVYIHGTYEIWNCHRRYPRLKGKTACVFGSPLDFSSFHDGDKKALQQKIAKTVMGSIASLRAWYLAGALGTPP